MKIQYPGAAKEDLREGFSFYESQESGLGIYSLETLYSDIDSLKLFGGIHSIHFGNFYRMLSKRFPFAIYYRLEGQVIKVYTVVNCRRNPAWIRERLT